MQKKQLLTISVVGIAIIIFSLWIFSLKYIFRSRINNEDVFLMNIKNTIKNINQSFQEARTELNKKPSANEPSAPDLTDDQMSKLKEKILELK